MTAKYVVTDEHRLTLQKRLHDFSERFFKGAVNPNPTLKCLQWLQEDKADELLGNIAKIIPVNYLDRIIAKTEKLLSKRFGRKVEVDPLPEILTEENLKKVAKFNLRPVFSPGKEILEGRKPKDWIALPEKFFQWERDKKIAAGSAIWPRGWYLADFSVGTDYADDTQVFCDDPLSPLIERLRKAGKVGKHDKTPLGSRFAIIPNTEWPLVFAELANELGFCAAKQISLEPYGAFNIIGNIYDKNRGKFNMWEWFSDIFGDSDRLHGGYRRRGGLADVDYDWDGYRYDVSAGRPLVSFK